MNANTATKSLTAYNTFAALVLACRAGYVPTIKGDTEAHRTLRGALKSQGLAVWTG